MVAVASTEKVVTPHEPPAVTVSTLVLSLLSVTKPVVSKARNYRYSSTGSAGSAPR